MAIPATRADLKEWCLRENGKPVIEINIADEQVEDAIDDAINFYQEYNYDGIERTYIAHQITASDVTNRYVDLSAFPDVSAVSRIIPFGGNDTSQRSLFSIEYQLRLNDLWSLVRTDITQYAIARQYFSLLDDMLNAPIRHRFQRHTGRLHIDDKWGAGTTLAEDNYIVIDAWQFIDPETHTKMYGDWILRKLAAAYVARRWGKNLSKFQSIQLPGGVTLNGDQILQQAESDIERIERDYIMRWSDPDDFMTG